MWSKCLKGTGPDISLKSLLQWRLLMKMTTEISVPVELSLPVPPLTGNFPGHYVDTKECHRSSLPSCGKCCLICCAPSRDCTGWVPPSPHFVNCAKLRLALFNMNSLNAPIMTALVRSSSPPCRSTSRTWLPTLFSTSALQTWKQRSSFHQLYSLLSH